MLSSVTLKKYIYNTRQNTRKKCWLKRRELNEVLCMFVLWHGKPHNIRFYIKVYCTGVYKHILLSVEVYGHIPPAFTIFLIVRIPWCSPFSKYSVVRLSYNKMRDVSKPSIALHLFVLVNIELNSNLICINADMLSKYNTKSPIDWTKFRLLTSNMSFIHIITRQKINFVVVDNRQDK